MPKCATRLIDRAEVAERTMAFGFERPAGLAFKAGQFVTLTLPKSPHNDKRGNRRSFTIASPPGEAGRLEFVTRMTGHAFKRCLAEVPIGTPFEILGPSGEFTLHDDASVPAVFIAGGIGITPFRSMALDAVARRLKHQLLLLYSNRTPEGAVYHDELVRLATAHPELRYVPTMTQAEGSRRPWTGERRRLDERFLRDYVDDLGRPIFYVAGPPGIVAAVAAAVAAAGATPERVLTDEFDGY